MTHHEAIVVMTRSPAAVATAAAAESAADAVLEHHRAPIGSECV
jgi:hypothetical protein